jgi:uncharacterized protein (TIGR03435 family)
MLQTLLADRFSLQIHRETKPLPVYLLTVAKNGPKLKAAAQPGNGSVLWGLAGKPSGEASVHLTAKAASLPRLADSLSNIAGRPVLDQTGLNGSFDFTLEYASEANTPGATPFAGPALFTAFQEQLGLKLEATRAPLEILVIDHVEKPSPN